jgi:hypothetical protein
MKYIKLYEQLDKEIIYKTKYKHYKINDYVIGLGYNNDIEIHNRIGIIRDIKDNLYGIQFIENFSTRQRKINDKFFNENGLWIKKENIFIISDEQYKNSLKCKILFSPTIKIILPFYNIICDDNIERINISKDNDNILIVNNIPIRVGRLYKKLFPEFSNIQIEKIVNYYKYKYNENITKTISLEVVNGEEIRKWYDCNNYRVGGGTLNSSCMRFNFQSKLLDLYVKENCVKLLVLKNEDDLLLGRSLLWNIYTPYKLKYMDKIYTVNDKYVDFFINYAKEEKFILYKDYELPSNSDDIIKYYGVDIPMTINNIDHIYIDNHPHTDTFKCYYPKENLLTNYRVNGKNVIFFM